MSTVAAPCGTVKLRGAVGQRGQGEGQGEDSWEALGHE